MMTTKDVGPMTVLLPPSADAAQPASWVQKTSGVVGGDACIRRTRVTVWGLIERRNLGLSDAEILNHLPDLTQSDLDAATRYYELNRQEIDDAIRDNEDV